MSNPTVQTPTDTLASIPRSETEQLRVDVATYEGHKFVNLRIWFKSGEQWFPSKKGCSVRRKDLDVVIAALEEARRRIGGVR